ncbi:LB_289 family protein [Nannocystaceae bacterium ST9]
MKRTDQERIAREIGRQEKKARIQERRASDKEDVSVAGYARRLETTFMWDDDTIYNMNDDAVLELMMEMKQDLSERDCEAALKRAIKTTGVSDKTTAYDEAMLVLADA